VKEYLRRVQPRALPADPLESLGQTDDPELSAGILAVLHDYALRGECDARDREVRTFCRLSGRRRFVRTALPGWAGGWHGAGREPAKVGRGVTYKADDDCFSHVYAPLHYADTEGRDLAEVLQLDRHAAALASTFEWRQRGVGGEQQERASSFGSPRTASAGHTASQEDKPDKNGYVEWPSDPAAYVAASEILSNHTPADQPITWRKLPRILNDYATNRVRWTRPRAKSGRPVPNRRSLHLGDWTAYLKRRTPELGGFPQLSEAELERRRMAVRNARSPGK
jgi:hypothetical protein